MNNDQFLVISSDDPLEAQRELNVAFNNGYVLRSVTTVDYYAWIVMVRATPAAPSFEPVPVAPPSDSATADNADPVVTLLSAFSKLTHSQQVQVADQLPEAVKEYLKYTDDFDWLPTSADKAEHDYETLPLTRWTREEEHQTDGASE